MIFQLQSGLTISESTFENAEGGRGVIGGPHKVSTTLEIIMQKMIFISLSCQSNIICTGMVIK